MEMQTEQISATTRPSVEAGAVNPVKPILGSLRRAARGPNLRVEARRRRIQANLVFAGSSALVVAVVAICYALLNR
ncbi:MAG TPA: hypothetical protein VHJ20_04045 [Polyangia bacterium]|nr:hypothetical protein [Polyangia bacterium]